jgi:DNA repair protein RecO (recombination protein O)
MQFQPFNVSWSGRGDLRTLKKAEWQGGVPALPPARLFCGFYLNELMLKLLARDDAHEHLFDCYENALIRLAASESEAGVLRGFEKAMLRETGYALALTLDPFAGDAVRPEGRYTYVPGRGPRRLVNGDASDLELAGQTLLDIERDDYSHPRTASEAKLLMRMLVQHQMNGRPLATRQVFSQLLEL